MSLLRILILKIHNVRGIRDLDLELGGENVAIWGPNGSGKSAVVDALDFLLTGSMSRLEGAGTSGISLRNHGPHINSKPEDARVSALIRLPGGEELGISRSLSDPKNLVFPAEFAEAMAPVLDLASQGQYILTRREILKYITAPPGERAQGIQELLRLSSVELRRKALGSAVRSQAKTVKECKARVVAARSDLGTRTGIVGTTDTELLAGINDLRVLLLATPISSLSSSQVMSGIIARSVASNKQDLANIERSASSVQQRITAIEGLCAGDTDLVDSLSKLCADAKNLVAIDRHELASLALEQVPDTGECPVCGASWPPGDLKSRLDALLRTSETAVEQYREICSTASLMADACSSLLKTARELDAYADKSGLQKVLSSENDAALLKHIDCLRNPLGTWVSTPEVAGCLPIGFKLDEVRATSDKIVSDARALFPEVTPEETAYLNLVRATELLVVLENEVQALQAHEQVLVRAEALLTTFVSSRDSVLGDLYIAIKDRFVALYRQLHSEDGEAAFDALLEPDEAALKLEVNFHGQGSHPPHALHSEGHQDSMGVCLYLALLERLTKGVLELTVLDDVVMSVDMGHRRALCGMLAKEFSDRQFVITTHDRAWARLLANEGVVKNDRNLVQFFDWSVSSGPRVNSQGDLWGRIGERLKQEDVPGAAAALRHGAEEFCSAACDALGSTVPYRAGGAWTLGDLMSGAYSGYLGRLKEAKKAAVSWGNTALEEEIEEKLDVAHQIWGKTGAESWFVNPTVHYDNWITLSRQDFEPVVDAFSDFFHLFTCSTCAGILRLARAGFEPTNLRCSCGSVDYNLMKKK